MLVDPVDSHRSQRNFVESLYVFRLSSANTDSCFEKRVVRSKVGRSHSPQKRIAFGVNGPALLHLDLSKELQDDTTASFLSVRNSQVTRRTSDPSPLSVESGRISIARVSAGSAKAKSVSQVTRVTPLTALDSDCPRSDR